jgi:hypothetical protein
VRSACYELSIAIASALCYELFIKKQAAFGRPATKGPARVMETPTMPGTFALAQRKPQPRRFAAFDKCRVFEIKNSALLLDFSLQDIKDIKRDSALEHDPREPGDLIKIKFPKNQDSAEMLGIFQVAKSRNQVKRDFPAWEIKSHGAVRVKPAIIGSSCAK